MNGLSEATPYIAEDTFSASKTKNLLTSLKTIPQCAIEQQKLSEKAVRAAESKQNFFEQN